VRYFGIMGVLAAAIATQVYADNVKKLCVGLRADTDTSVHAEERKDLLLTEEQCEAAKRQEFRLKLYEIPQEDEDPMALSLGAKQGGGIVRFKIPFSW
jgi:uncharacterized protein YqfA (UPF0365 family)